MIDESREVEQDIVIEEEINKIIFAGLTSIDDLKRSILTLCGLYDVESNSPSPVDISRDLVSLVCEYDKGDMTEEDRDIILKDVLAKAMTVQSPLNTPLS